MKISIKLKSKILSKLQLISFPFPGNPSNYPQNCCGVINSGWFLRFSLAVKKTERRINLPCLGQFFIQFPFCGWNFVRLVWMKRSKWRGRLQDRKKRKESFIVKSYWRDKKLIKFLGTIVSFWEDFLLPRYTLLLQKKKKEKRGDSCGWKYIYFILLYQIGLIFRTWPCEILLFYISSFSFFLFRQKK